MKNIFKRAIKVFSTLGIIIFILLCGDKYTVYSFLIVIFLIAFTLIAYSIRS